MVRASRRWLIVTSSICGLACTPETPRPTADQTCFSLDSNNSSECESTVCFQKSYSVVDTQNAGSTGLQCADTSFDVGGACKPPAPAATSPNSAGGVITQDYVYQGDGHMIRLSFDNRILLDYSLENFRKYLVGGYAAVSTPAGSLMTTGTDTIEILDYQNDLLHVSVAGEAAFIRAFQDAPHLCTADLGLLPAICPTITCDYSSHAAGGTGEPVQIAVEVTVPVAQPQP